MTDTGTLSMLCSSELKSEPFQPFPKRQILDPFNFKDYADDNFKFDENSQKFSKRFENAVEKG